MKAKLPLARLEELVIELNMTTNDLLREAELRTDDLSITHILERPSWAARWLVDNLEFDEAVAFYNELHAALKKADKKIRRSQP